MTPSGIYITTQPDPGSYLQAFLTLLSPGKKAKVVLVTLGGSDLAYLKELMEAGKMRSVIDRTYPLSEVSAAHTYSEQGHAVGKIVITAA